jgi:hypothetical protein
MDNTVLLSIVGILISFVITILCYFLKGILDEMKYLNSQLIEVVTNQRWHYSSIVELQSNVAKIINDILKLKSNHREVEL